MNDNILDQKWSAASLLRFAFPTIVMMIFMGLYIIVDTILVAQFVNTDALSSINIVCPIINITVGLATMIATGGNAIVSRKMGQVKIRRQRKISLCSYSQVRRMVLRFFHIAFYFVV